MAVDLVGLRAAIAAKIKANIEAGVNVYDGYVPPAPMLPCILVQPAPDYITYTGTFGRPRVDVRLDVVMLTDPGMGTDGQRLLDQFLSVGDNQPNSVYDALSDYPKIDGAELVVNSAEYGFRDVWATPDAQMLVDRASISLSVNQHG